MKNILIVNSTFRKKGNSEILAAEFERGAVDGGNIVKTINLRDIELKYCIGCLSCQKTGKCVLNDDVGALLPLFAAADVLVFATPVYYYSVSGQLKTMIDRINPLFCGQYNFREIYLIACAADEDASAADGAVKAVQGFADCFDGVELKGVLRGVGVENAGEVLKRQNYLETAYEMGKSV